MRTFSDKLLLLLQQELNDDTYKSDQITISLVDGGPAVIVARPDACNDVLVVARENRKGKIEFLAP